MKKYLSAGRRLAVRRFEDWEDWWVGTSPRNGDNASVEGTWAEWVDLAQQILAVEAERLAALAPSERTES